MYFLMPIFFSPLENACSFIIMLAVPLITSLVYVISRDNQLDLFSRLRLLFIFITYC